MRHVLLVAVLLVAMVAPATAERDPLFAPAHATAIDALSTGLVSTAIALDTWRAWHATDRADALRCQALRSAVVVGLAALAKQLVPRTRPDGSDAQSFFSEHTALSAATLPRGAGIGASVLLTIGVGAGRMGAGKHYPSDVAVGVGVGWIASRVCHVESKVTP